MEIRKIIVGADFSPQSEVAAKEALRVGRHTGAEVVLVHVGSVVGSFQSTGSAANAELEALAGARTAAARQQLEQMRTRLDGQGVDVSHMIIEGPPAEGLAEAARRLGAELVITGTVGRGAVKRFLLGSVAERTVRLSPCSVMVARDSGPRTGGGYKHIMVPTDFSNHANAALAQAIGLASPDATIDVVHFWQLPVVPASYDGVHLSDASLETLHRGWTSDAEKRGREAIAPYAASDRTVTFETVRGRASDGIVERAEARKPELIVMGSHGYRGFKRLLLGSVAERVVRHAPCSTVVVHLPKND